MKSILITNDDGIDAEGLKVLEDALDGIAHVIVVAPDQERSAVSHGLTIHSPLSFQEIRPGRYTVNGTPADCVLFALHKLLLQYPDLVISGINHGANLGDDIMYSGTVAAAREASRHGIPAMAVSQAYRDGDPIHFKRGGVFVRHLVSLMLERGLNGELCLNVNIPIRKIKGTRITRQGYSEHAPHFNALDDHPEYDGPPEKRAGCSKSALMSDRQAVEEHFVSITPLQRDQTDYTSARSLLREAEQLFPMK